TGGDEFMAFLHADAEKAYDLSRALNREAEKWSGALVQNLSLSVGYVVAREHQTAGIEDLIRMADEKMYEAKANFYMQSGKNRRRNDRRRAAIEQKQKEYMDIISSFASDVTGLYVIDKEKREVTAYRTSASDHRIRSGVPMDIGFEAAMNQFIDSRVHPDDKEPMRMNVQLDFISRELAEKKSFIYHFRTLINGEINYHYMKCIRNLEGEDYDKIIVSFCPEDNITVRKKVLESAGAIRNSRKTLLLVDKEDEESLRLRDMLEQEFICLETQTGKEALCILKEKRNDITAVLYREDIADINALQFLGEMDKDDDLEGIPVIVMSDSRQESAEKEYINAGATELFRRPYDFTILRHRLENVIKMKMVSDSLDEIETDDLTGLYTKQAFFYHARVLIDASPEESFTIVISDILNFKIYNTVYGESKGDELLQNLAQKIHKSVQSGIVARYGADQIIVIGKTPAGKDITWHVTHIQEYVNRELKENVTLKFGIYENVDHSLDIARMCDRALVALKASKGNFDSNYAKFDGPVSQQQLRGQFYESIFRSAIDNEEFVVWYQPKYSPYTEKIVGAEALVRWKTSDGGMLSPGEFLPVFEEDGLIRELDEYVFRKVCAEQKKWVDRNVKIIPISVNLSRNSMHQSNVVKRYKAIVEEYNISPACVPIEITESAAIGNEEIKPLADAFYEAGFSLHMDDFGSGKSSIAGLNYLHFDTVKLDRSLIEFIGNEDGNLVLMYTVALGKELGLHLVAEGVETVEQVNYLKDIGCETIQGYYYSRPLPVEEFEKLVHEKKELDEAHFDPRYKFTATDSVVKRAMDRMLQRMPGGFFTYRSDDSTILSSNHYLWKMFGCETEAEFMEYVGGTFKGMGFEEDLQTVEEFIAQQIEKDSEEMDYVEYRILRKDGQKIPVVDYGHLDHQADGGIFYVFITEANKPYRM
ncbi:MAG: EAL domain-containing protein, partial [Clostridiales bacterium]|nr:EAL domain-containing protein [Candidatus Blautia equi]